MLMERVRGIREQLAVDHYRRQGKFRKAVEEVRTYWRIDAVPVRVPAESEDVLLPPVFLPPVPGTRGDLPALHDAWSHHPHLSPGPPSEEHEVVRNLQGRWQDDLRHALRRGGVPKEYLADRFPYEGIAPVSAHQLAWLRFAAACVLYEVPGELFLSFAEYGGGLLGTVSEREVRRQETACAVDRALEAMISRRLWELRSELGELDYDQAKQKAADLIPNELWLEESRLWEEHERELEDNPPRLYYLEFDPGRDVNEEVLRQLGAIREAEGRRPKGGRPRIDGLTAVQCAILHRDHNSTDPEDGRVKTWAYPKLAARFKERGVKNARSAEEHVKRGQESLKSLEGEPQES